MTDRLPSRSTLPANQERLRLLLDERLASGNDPEYRVAPGDVLTVTIYSYYPGKGDFVTDLRVDSQGYGKLPMIDPVPLRGLSLGETREGIAAALRAAQVMRRPMVDVTVRENVGQQVQVLGEVGRPGSYPIARGRLTIVDLMTMAGGMGRTAGNYVLLLPASARPGGGPAGVDPIAAPRPAMYGGSAQPHSWGDVVEGNAGAPLPASVQNVHDLELSDRVIAISLGANVGLDSSALITLPLRGGDLVVVPDAGQAFLEGEVEKPGLYKLAHGMTLAQVIATAGGLAFPAEKSTIRLVRQAPAGENSQWLIDLDRIYDQKLQDVLIEPNDRIVVPAQPVKKVVYTVYEVGLVVFRISIGGALSVF